MCLDRLVDGTPVDIGYQVVRKYKSGYRPLVHAWSTFDKRAVITKIGELRRASEGVWAQCSFLSSRKPYVAGFHVSHTKEAALRFAAIYSWGVPGDKIGVDGRVALVKVRTGGSRIVGTQDDNLVTVCSESTILEEVQP